MGALEVINGELEQKRQELAGIRQRFREATDSSERFVLAVIHEDSIRNLKRDIRDLEQVYRMVESRQAKLEAESLDRHCSQL